MNNNHYWKDIAKRLQKEHPDNKPPAKWTRRETQPLLDKLLEKVGFSISYATFRRIFKEGEQGKAETKDIFAKYYEYESHRHYIDQHLTPKEKKRKRIYPIAFIVSVLGLLLFFVGKTTLSNNRYNDKKAVLQIVRKAVEAEFASYQAIPHYERQLDSLKVLYWEDDNAYKKILQVLEGQTAYGWVLTNGGNPSDIELEKITLDSIVGERAYVTTKEHWRLEWYGSKSLRYEYFYDEINTQHYTLTKEGDIWKISINKYDDKVIREIPEYINCDSLKAHTIDYNSLRVGVQQAAAKGNVHLMLRMIDCHHSKQSNILPADLLLLMSAKNDLHRDLNTDKVGYEVFKINKQKLINEVLQYLDDADLYESNPTDYEESAESPPPIQEKVQVTE